VRNPGNKCVGLIIRRSWVRSPLAPLVILSGLLFGSCTLTWVTGRYRYAHDKAPTLEAAKKLREEMLERIADGRDPATRATVGELLDRWLELAELELTTRVSTRATSSG
jgi:hypothetical protein